MCKDLPVLFEEWAHLLVIRTQDVALVAFKAMARKNSTDPNDESPLLSAKHPRRHGRTARVFCDLSEPKGVHDHCLFKSSEDTNGSRKYAGQRRPQDYQCGRAARIDFISVVLEAPDFVYQPKNDPATWIYGSRTGADENFLVIVHVRAQGEPGFSLISAYHVTDAEWRRKKVQCILLHPKMNKAKISKKNKGKK